MKRWILLTALLILFPICSIMAASTDCIKWYQSRPGLLSLDNMLGQDSVAFASTEDMDNGSGKDGPSMKSDVERESVSPVTLDKRDRIFVLLVFIGSIVAAVASVVSMIIKIRRSKLEGGIDLLKENIK